MLKVATQLIVSQMDGAEVTSILHMDTVISTIPNDPGSEIALAKEVLARLLAQLSDEGTERLDEYGMLLARHIGGMS